MCPYSYYYGIRTSKHIRHPRLQMVQYALEHGIRQAASHFHTASGGNRWCRGPGIDGFYHCGERAYQPDDLLRLLLDWGLLEVFGVEVLEKRTN